MGWILDTILFLTGYVAINDECIFRLCNKHVATLPYGARPAIPCLPHIKRGLIPNVDTHSTAEVFVC